MNMAVNSAAWHRDLSLWGDQAKPRDAVYLDMWDDYLEPA